MFKVTCISYQSQTRTLNLVDTAYFLHQLYLMHEHRTSNNSGLLVGVLCMAGTDQLGCILFHNFITDLSSNFFAEASVALDIRNKDMAKGFYYLILFLL